MDPKIVLTKTEKGIEEIRTRANRLPQHHRNVLIFVDGRFSVGDLVGRFSNLGDLAETLQSLVDDGYIAPKSSATMSPRPVAPEPAPATAGPARVAPTASPAQAGVNFAVPGHQQAEFKKEVRALSRSLYDAIGPDADNVTAKLEAAADRESFNRAVASCARMVEALAGRKKAEALRERAQSIVERFLSG